MTAPPCLTTTLLLIVATVVAPFVAPAATLPAATALGTEPAGALPGDSATALLAGSPAAFPAESVGALPAESATALPTKSPPALPAESVGTLPAAPALLAESAAALLTGSGTALHAAPARPARHPRSPALASFTTHTGPSPPARPALQAASAHAVEADGANVGNGSQLMPGQLPEPEPRFGWPLTPHPQVTRPFQAPESDFGAGHRGVDLAANPDQQVLAAGPGVVVFSGQVAGRGVVSIDHDGGLRTTYEPVTPLVATGAEVYRGQPIATVSAGHPGCPAAACLHWGVRRGDEYLNPLGLIQTESVIRLKPWLIEP